MRESITKGHSAGFGPVSRSDAVGLILGSLPGRRSLRECEYYAQPQNAFWKMMDELYGAGRHLKYAQRLARLVDNRIALWDVLQSARRQGSLDSAIEADSVIVNDFPRFLAAHPRIRLICFNGQAASKWYARCVIGQLSPSQAAIETRVLPSTSPAYASMNFEAKRERWATVLNAL